MLGPEDKMINNMIPCSQEAHSLEETHMEAKLYNTTLAHFFSWKAKIWMFTGEGREDKSWKTIFLGNIRSNSQIIILLAETYN